MKKLLFVFTLLILDGCAYRNRTTISNIAELDGMLYITTDDGAFNSFDIKKNQFEKITAFDEFKITKIIPSKENLHIETGRTLKDKENKIVTHNSIYSISKQGQIINNLNVVSDGYPQYESSLISADDKYFYALKNDLIERKDKDKEFEFIVNSFRYDKRTKKKIKNHFDENNNLIVLDIVEDNHYFWYACYSNSVATHWTTIKGNLVVVRRDKITNEQKLINLGSDIFDRGLYITEHNNSIWVLGETWFKKKFIKISKNDFAYETLQVNDLVFLISDKSLKNNDDYFWFISEKEYEGLNSKFTLNGFNKWNGEIIQISIPDGSINSLYQAGVVDDKFIWLGLSQVTPPQPGFAKDTLPYLLKVSKSDLSTKMIPIDTTFKEGISNVMKNILAGIAMTFFYIFGLKT